MKIGVIEQRLRSLIEDRGRSDLIPRVAVPGGFPVRETKPLALALVTQNIVLDFEPMTPEMAALLSQEETD